jgi:hypothetical protein
MRGQRAIVVTLHPFQFSHMGIWLTVRCVEDMATNPSPLPPPLVLQDEIVSGKVRVRGRKGWHSLKSVRCQDGCMCHELLECLLCPCKVQTISIQDPVD